MVTVVPKYLDPATFSQRVTALFSYLPLTRHEHVLSSVSWWTGRPLPALVVPSVYWLGCGLDDRGSILGKTLLSFPPQHLDRRWDLSSLIFISYLASFLAVKQLECEGNSLPWSNAEFNFACSCTSTPQYICVGWYVVKHQALLFFYPCTVSQMASFH
jgi:hypothetical protein